MSVKSYKDLDVWKKSMLLTNLVYDCTQQFPKEEQFGLSCQMRRAVVSIPSNIAEGSIRGSKPEFSRFINIARGSLAELETQMIISHDRKYVMKSCHDEVVIIIEEINKMLFGLLRSLKN
ncbi:MAG: four helix bundle protein [Rickettsiales bacterium]